ncbi:SURF1 family protein [Serinibacter arcticus]|uniref:SURF1 family protein n=1 Tax=Serinibacter arcticus TaxID=1655435 RepID=UPI0011B27448|nr:SURF1 family protein [Serinibacter arcticus]
MNRAGSRTVGVVGLLLLGVAVCVLLGLWQLSRHNDRVAQVDLITTNLDAPVAPLTDVLGDDLDPQDVWRPVTVTGTWVEGSGVQLRNRPVQDANASHALALFRTDETPARVLVVDRGWWRQTDVVPDGSLEVPGGTSEIVVRLRAQEDLDERANPAGEVFRVHPGSVLEQTSLDADALDGALVTSAYGMIVSPVPTTPLGALPDPDTSLRSHLSYALQWWFFAAAIPVAAVVLKRRADAEDAEAAAEAAGEERPVAARRRRASMEDEEDALLDAAERAAAERAAADRATAGRRDQASEISSA